MLRSAVAVVVAVIYVALAAYFVSQEGASYRASLAKGSIAARQPIEPESKPPTLPDRPVVASPPAAAPKPIEEPARETAPVPVPVPAPIPKPVTEPPRPRPKPDAWVDQLSLTSLKPGDEARLGQELHEAIVGVLPTLPDSPSIRRVSEVAEPLLALRSRKEIEYQFTIIDSDSVNAFSHPGGYLYVSQGLLDFAGEEEGHGLEFVLAHEIAHVDLGHAIKVVAARKDEARKAGIGTIQQFLIPLTLAYPNDLEYEADAWAFRQLKALDRTPHQIKTFLRRYDGLAQKQNFPNGRRKPPEGSNPLMNHLPAHPSPYERLKRLN